MLKRILSLLLSFGLLFQQIGFAQVVGELNIANRLGLVGNNLAQDKFRPVHLRYFSYDNLNDSFKLLLDKGDARNLTDSKTKETTKKLLNYFLIGIALPDSMFWVNLRPDSADQIVDPYLEKTDVGKIMLEADLQLKKDTASFTSPQTPIGKKYWNKLYQKSAELYGQQNVSIPTLTRPWIVPGEIIVRESAGSAYVYKANLKVMLEQDHLKGSATYNFKDARAKALNEYSSQLMRELIIPQLTKEVNSAKRYAPLRQVYYSLILARWFKLRFTGKAGTYSALINSKNIENFISKEAWSKNSYFKQYQKSFAEGEYNVKEPVYTPTGQVIRSYFSGGIAMAQPEITLDAFTSSVSKVPKVSRDEESAELGGPARIENIKIEETVAVPTNPGRSTADLDVAVKALNNNRFLRDKYDFKIENGTIVVRPKEQNTVAKRTRMLLNNLIDNVNAEGKREYGVFIGELDPAINDFSVINVNTRGKAGLVNVLAQIKDALGPVEGLEQRVDLSKINADTVNSDAASFIEEARKLGVIRISGLGASGQETLEINLKRLRQEGVLIINLDQFIAEDTLANQKEIANLFLDLLERKIHLAVISGQNNAEVTQSISEPMKAAVEQAAEARIVEKKYPNTSLIKEQVRNDLFRFPDRFTVYANGGTFRIDFNNDVISSHSGTISAEINSVDQEAMEMIIKSNLGLDPEVLSWYMDSNLWRIQVGEEIKDANQVGKLILTRFNQQEISTKEKEDLIKAVKLIAEGAEQEQIEDVVSLISSIFKENVVLEWKNNQEKYDPEKESDRLTPQDYLRQLLTTVQMRNVAFALELLQSMGETLAINANKTIDENTAFRGNIPRARSEAIKNNVVILELNDLYSVATDNIPAAIDMPWCRYRMVEAGKNILQHEFDAIAPTDNVVSQKDVAVLPLEANSKPADALGGIDFRVLQMSIQPMGSFRGLDFKMPRLTAAELSKININVEVQQIKNMVKSGMLPSGQRVKELVAACLQKGQMNVQSDNLLLCLADIFKLEEENAQETSPELREALVIVDSQS